MGAPYTSKSVGATYSQNPPSDDGTQSEANRIKYSTIKTKLTDPVKAYGDSINAELLLAFAKVPGGGGVTAVSSTYTVQTSDQGNLLAVSAAVTVTTPAAATVGNPFVFAVVNNHTAAITVDGNASETINGLASISLGAGDSAIFFTDGSNWFAVGTVTNRFSAGHIHGLTLSNNATDSDHDIDIAVGEARDDGNDADLILSTALTKQIDASWAVGTDAGGLDGSESVDGTPDADTWYHVWLIRRSDTGVVDALFSESATAPTMPTNYDQKRRIGAVLTDGSANILGFFQSGDEFLWDSPIEDFDAAPNTAGTTATLSVPTGVNTRAIINIGGTAGANEGFLIYASSNSQDNDAASGSEGPLATIEVQQNITAATRIEILTDTSAGIRVRATATGGTRLWRGGTMGWIDYRGKDA